MRHAGVRGSVGSFYADIRHTGDDLDREPERESEQRRGAAQEVAQHVGQRARKRTTLLCLVVTAMIRA